MSSFYRKARGIVRGVYASMKEMRIWFDHPVEANVVPDYYKVIKSPMDLGTIEKKLGRKAYSTPAEFRTVRPTKLRLSTQPTAAASCQLTELRLQHTRSKPEHCRMSSATCTLGLGLLSSCASPAGHDAGLEQLRAVQQAG